MRTVLSQLHCLPPSAYRDELMASADMREEARSLRMAFEYIYWRARRRPALLNEMHHRYQCLSSPTMRDAFSIAAYPVEFERTPVLPQPSRVFRGPEYVGDYVWINMDAAGSSPIRCYSTCDSYVT